MRKITQFFVFFLIANVVVTAVSAQLPKVLVFGNVTYANPVGSELKNISNYGIGYEVGGGVGFGKTILTASIGRISYHLPEQVLSGVTVMSEDHFKVTPIRFGVRRYLLLGLFLNGNLGLASTSSKSYFLYEGGAGYKLGFLEIGASYMGFKMGNIDCGSLLFKGGLAIKI